MLPVTLRTSHFWLLDPFDISPISVISISKRIQTTASYHIVHIPKGSNKIQKERGRQRVERGSKEGRRVEKCCGLPGPRPISQCTIKLAFGHTILPEFKAHECFHIFSYVFICIHASSRCKKFEDSGFGGPSSSEFQGSREMIRGISTNKQLHVDACWRLLMCAKETHQIWSPQAPWG
jgi:hypothetical protein